ncbi:MAG: adenine deaminase [Acidaminococcaceae bacterium]|jgi:adenine deaminase|nr:adenine deaminase [Acidaminococcaceae bacterium]
MTTKVLPDVDLAEKIAVGAGRHIADLVFKGGQVFNVFTGSWEQADLAISGTTIVGVGKDYRGIQEYDVSGCYLTPGFLDAHMHIESTMLAPRELAKVLLLNGVTGIFADPHEIANVLGLDGLRFMLHETEDLPLDVYFLAPSCVPATGMETSGATLKAADLQTLLDNPRLVGLGEMMNYPGVVNGIPEVLEKLSLPGKPLVDGHAPGLAGKQLNAYLTAGISSEHEAVTLEEAKEKLARGMYVFLREGSSAHNLLDLLPLVHDKNCRRCCLATDDRHLDDLISEGSINYLIEAGVIHGYPVEQLLTMATLNAAEHFRQYDLGALAPGYKADINIFKDLTTFEPELVCKDGQILVKDRQLLWESAPVSDIPTDSMHLQPLTAASFKITATGKKVYVMVVNEDKLVTEKRTVEPKVEDGVAVSDTGRDILKLAVCERHHATGNIGLGFVQGFKLHRGALASTVAHDSHNLIIVGTNDEDMLVAANALVDAGGGLVVAEGGKVRALLPLPVAGLMSACPSDEVLSQLKELQYWSRELGVPESMNAFMQLSFLALPVIPHLKLTDKGLVDVDVFAMSSLWAE